MSPWIWIALLSPGLSSALLLALHAHEKRVSKSYEYVPWLGVSLQALSAFASLTLAFSLWNQDAQQFSWTWLEISPFFELKVSLLLSNAHLMMLSLVNGISLLVHIYSVAYMKEDQARTKYFSWLALFTATMAGFVMAGDLLSTFLFWEWIGLSSYLLIGFWNTQSKPPLGSMRALLVNKAGDIAFLIVLVVAWDRFKTFDLQHIEAIAAQEPGRLCGCYLWMGGGLLLAAMVKSAQVPFSVWLSEAMAGPTPVSSLMHAATMVTAGVFLLAKTYFLFPVAVLDITAFVGAFTAFLGAVTALQQTDIKKLLAYSTISQLGYMMLAMGTGAYEAGLLHLFTHAFFKCALFLGAGALIHEMEHIKHKVNSLTNQAVSFDTQDMRLMGGFFKQAPKLAIIYLLASFALMGLPLFSGFLSKDAILLGTWEWVYTNEKQLGLLAWLPLLLGFATVLLTAWYVGKHLLLILWGEFRLPYFLKRQVSYLNETLTEKTTLQSAEKLHTLAIHDLPLLMLFPMALLALASLFLVLGFNPLDASHSWFVEGLSRPDSSVLAPRVSLHQVPHWLVGFFSVALLLLGALRAWRSKTKLVLEEELLLPPTGLSAWLGNHYGLPTFFYAFVPQLALKTARGMGKIEQHVLDEVPTKAMQGSILTAHLLSFVDRWIVDGLVHFVVALAKFMGSSLRRLTQQGIQAWLVIIFLISLILLLFNF